MGMFFKKKDLPKASCVIAAAGSGTRMGAEKNKILLELQDEAVIYHTILPFMESGLIDEIIIVAREEDMVEINSIVRENGFDKVTKIIRGGNTRTESVKLGAMEAKCDIVCVHDGARPLVTTKIIDEAILKCLEFDAVTCAVKVKDTIKEIDGENKVKGTLSRDNLYHIQTPQVFKKELLMWAYEKTGQGFFNDDCEILERLGIDVYISEGSYENIKITTKEDLIFANAILSARF